VQQDITPLQQRNEAFRAFLDTLNPAQRRAVDQTEGPVLVIAGPGAGKTQLLTARIGKILLDTDTKAHNILCLTFTDAGAQAMRQRLIQRIGPEAWRVPIFTFHAFCNRVIQDNLEYFGKKQLDPVSELERIEIVRGLLAKLPTDHPLREGKKDVFLYENQLRDLFSNMKKQDWTPGALHRHADLFIQEMPQNPDFLYQRNAKGYKKGDLKATLAASWTEKMLRLKAAADLFPKYVNSMERAGRYEYEDMVLWVTRAFEKNRALLQGYQERFQYVLVDEFQDTNGVQFHLLNLLLDYWEIPNVFIVGDDDQSIYEFQGARLENLRNFYEKYRIGLETIVLESNYRSSQDILDAAFALIAYNEIRAVRAIDVPIEKRLKAEKIDFKSTAMELHAYENPLQETAAVFARIAGLLDGGIPAEEIAVLYAKHKQVEALQALLEKKGILYHSKRPVNILDTPQVRQLRELLRYLHEEGKQAFSGEHRLFRILHNACFGLASIDLAKIAWSLRQTAAEPVTELYEKIGKRKSKAHFWRVVLGDATWLQEIGLEDPAAVLSVHHKLNQWIADVANLALAPLLERLIAQSGMLSYALNHADKVPMLQVLSSFLAFVKQESERTPRLSLSRLLELLDSMDDNKVPIPLQAALSDGPGVQLLTAHAAKGLEFGYVFLMGCTEDAWEKNKGGNRGRFALPPTLTFSGEEDALEAGQTPSLCFVRGARPIGQKHRTKPLHHGIRTAGV
jgi:DNA helicase II / ATP-dependent DNA helicase PcrA